MVFHRGLRLRTELYGEEFKKGISKATNAIRISLVALEESSFISNEEFYHLGWYLSYKKRCVLSPRKFYDDYPIAMKVYLYISS
jgi:hypothetical protein